MADKADSIDNEAFEKFKECAVEVLHVDPEKVTPDASFADDLDADSLDLVELVMALEEQFGITVDESELEGVSTVGQAFEPGVLEALMLAVHPSPDGRKGIQGRRVAITGIGVVAPCGIGRDAFWDGLLGPQPSGPRRVSPDFDATDLYGPKDLRRVDRFTQFAAVAAAEALADAGGLDSGGLSLDPDRTGVIIGTGVGGLETLETQIGVFRDRGARRVSPFLVPMMMGNRAAADVSMRYGFRGPCEATVTACAAGTHSVANGARLVATGRCDVVIAGSSEAGMTDTGIAGFTNMTALSSSGVSMPFDVKRDGFVISEGGAVLVLEELERARARGAHVYAEITGAAQHCRRLPHHLPRPARSRGSELHGAGPARRWRGPRRDRPHQRPRDLDTCQRPH